MKYYLHCPQKPREDQHCTCTGYLVTLVCALIIGLISAAVQ